LVFFFSLVSEDSLSEKWHWFAVSCEQINSVKALKETAVQLTANSVIIVIIMLKV